MGDYPTNQNGNLLRKFSALSTPYDVVQFRPEPVYRCKIKFCEVMRIFQKNKRKFKKIVQSFHQLPSAWPRIPGSRFSDESSGKTSIYGNGPLYREVCLHHCHAVSHELSLCKRRLNLQESTSLYIRELWQRGWKHQNVLFPKNSYAFASGASHSVSYRPAVWHSARTCSKLFSRENHE